MRLILSNNHDCVAASLAMVTGIPMSDIKEDLFTDLEYPFPPPWDKLPKVPNMDVICDYLWLGFRLGLTPFNNAPFCSPDVACPSFPVWEDAAAMFQRQLGFGPGLLEGTVAGKGHMCAWDGTMVFDPRGYAYLPDEADDLGFDIERFWLCR